MKKQVEIGGKVYKVFNSVEEAFPESFKSKSFVKLYTEEVARLDLVYQIKTMRHKQHLTQKALAAKIDMPQSVIARIESGKHSFSLSTIAAIARAFNTRLVFV